MRIGIPFAGPAYKSESEFISSQECINLYPRPYPEMGESKLALYGTPGLELFSTIGSDPIRGMITVSSTLYVVAGTGFYKVDSSGTKTLIDSLSSDTGNRVSMASNGLDITMVDGVNGYVYDLATEIFTTITDADFPASDVIVQIDGYYLVNKSGTGQIYRSDWNDGTSWGGLAFSTAGADPDNVVGLVVDHLDVWVIGEKSTEIWYNTGAATFNFSRIDGAYIEQGGMSPYAITKANNAVYWLGKDINGQGQIFQSTGRQPKVISTFPINHQISTYSTNRRGMFILFLLFLPRAKRGYTIQLSDCGIRGLLG